MLELSQESLVDGLVNEQPCAGFADLALVPQDGEGCAFHGLIPVRIGENDVGRLAAQFKGGRNDFLRCRIGDEFADTRRASEGKLAQVWMIQ